MLPCCVPSAFKPVCRCVHGSPVLVNLVQPGQTGQTWSNWSNVVKLVKRGKLVKPWDPRARCELDHLHRKQHLRYLVAQWRVPCGGFGLLRHGRLTCWHCVGPIGWHGRAAAVPVKVNVESHFSFCKQTVHTAVLLSVQPASNTEHNHNAALYLPDGLCTSL